MTRREICLKWLEGEFSDEEVRKHMKETTHPIRRDVDSSTESDSWWDGEEDNTEGALLGLYCLYSHEKMAEFFDKFWPKERIRMFAPDGRELVDLKEHGGLKKI